MFLFLSGIVFLTTIDEICQFNATLLPIFGRLRAYCSSSIGCVGAVFSHVFTAKLHVTLVNCVWGFFTCGPQIKLLHLQVILHAPILRQCYIYTESSLKHQLSLMFAVKSSMLHRCFFKEISTNHQWTINVSDIITLKTLKINNVCVEIINVASMSHPSLSNQQAYFFMTTYFQWIINATNVFLTGVFTFWNFFDQHVSSSQVCWDWAFSILFAIGIGVFEFKFAVNFLISWFCLVVLASSGGHILVINQVGYIVPSSSELPIWNTGTPLFIRWQLVGAVTACRGTTIHSGRQNGFWTYRSFRQLSR